MALSVEIRPAHDEDCLGLITLIGSTYGEYPGCVLDVEKEEPDLLVVATAYGERGGKFWVAVDPNQTVVGCVGMVPGQTPGWVEVKKLYVSSHCRRRGLATRLLGLVEAEAREQGATTLELWSDTRFSEGHQFYRARGFALQRETRRLFDLSRTTEFWFIKPLSQ